MNRRILAIVCAVMMMAAVGCSNECEQKCSTAYDKVEEAAGGNFSGPMETAANQALDACKSSCK
jgi:hypothetical protein